MNFKNQKVILGLMVFLALMLPVVTFLGQQKQESRSLAYSQLGQSCKYTSGCQPPLICSSGVCKNGPVRTGNQGLNQSCGNESDCRSPYVCDSSKCKVRSGGECARSGDCFDNHYCSRKNSHCKRTTSSNLPDYSVEGVSLSSLLGGADPITRPTTPPQRPTTPPQRPTTPPHRPTATPTHRPTATPTHRPTATPTHRPTATPTHRPTATPTITPVISRIILTPNPLNLKVGESKTITVKTIPVGLTASYQWETDKPDGADIAIVNMNGLVTGIKPGEAYVIVKVKDTDIEEKVRVVVTPDGTGPTSGPTATPPPSSSDASVSFKIAFAGIVPGAKCISTYLIPETKLELDIANVPSNNHEDKIPTSFEETNMKDSRGNQIFKVTTLTLDKSKFGSGNNFNYIKIKGPWHLKRKMCLDGQIEKLPEPTVCDISLTGDNVYDFSEYTLLSGDIDKNGVINTVDLSYIKTVLNPGAEINCGVEGDLNMDGVVNTFDLNLVKDTLTERDDE